MKTEWRKVVLSWYRSRAGFKKRSTNRASKNVSVSSFHLVNWVNRSENEEISWPNKENKTWMRCMRFWRKVSLFNSRQFDPKRSLITFALFEGAIKKKSVEFHKYLPFNVIDAVFTFQRRHFWCSIQKTFRNFFSLKVD